MHIDAEVVMKEEKESLGMTFVRLSKDAEESRIRLYGVLWLLVEQEMISAGRAYELGDMPLHKMIDQCMEYRASFEEREDSHHNALT